MEFHQWVDPVYSQQALERMLGKPLLRLNPYRISDTDLLEIAWNGNWGDEFDLTQMVILTFTRRRETPKEPFYDGLYVKLGRSDEEIFIPRSRLIHRATALDTLHQVRNLYGKKQLRDDEDLLKLIGKTVFVSRIIHCRDYYGRHKPAYRMHRLWGKPEKDATIIRQAMCEAKTEMLQRQLDMIRRMNISGSRPDLLPYRDRILRALSIIRSYPTTPIPDK